ncbi:TDP-4-oxo-6-deoxy-D-glucose aminotransferase [Paenibacillus sp. IHB B 3084]|uniref:dTDP-4-amino-4,6-dideoxygalactose transaminase n=1 Tax=Paenibacillus sp. IHB B 3084 TaxID=867076 RepID=UPI000721B4FB|nr:dTDP-4-amino-4,6-dideoxygalactose transaminase [Paenibacillus sp. IHB B 3084]ALP37271.1 TDP-4-oxo-6-deoxy-D-glucose aminotransferase [Paenibacillus sp. IHB B 3084]
MIDFNVPAIVGKEGEYIKESFSSGHLSGDGEFTRLCANWFDRTFNVKKTLITTSCTHALEMAAILLDIQQGDEIIMPSYTFVSTANAFVLRGAKIVFVDIRPDTMNINEDLIEDAITDKTKAIVPVHYAGVACDMDKILDLANRYNLVVVEDAAQGILSEYKGRKLGTIGHLGCISFHETKNVHCGEGGALLVNDDRFVEKAEIIREKGTNRSKFFRGQVDKYTWVNIGSSYLPSELNTAFLLAQLEAAEMITKNRLASWNLYFKRLKPLSEEKLIDIPCIPLGITHNAHIFYIKVRDLEIRTELLNFLRRHEIMAVFHYVPLHSSEAGLKHSSFTGKDVYTTRESERLIRLPLYFNIEESDINQIVDCIYNFFLQYSSSLVGGV